MKKQTTTSENMFTTTINLRNRFLILSFVREQGVSWAKFVIDPVTNCAGKFTSDDYIRAYSSSRDN